MQDLSGPVPSEGLVMLKFFATWCGPCKMLGPRLDELSEKHTDVQAFQIDADKNQTVLAAFNVRSLPTVVFMKDGKELTLDDGTPRRIVGMQRLADYENIIDANK